VLLQEVYAKLNVLYSAIFIFKEDFTRQYLFTVIGDKSTKTYDIVGTSKFKSSKFKVIFIVNFPMLNIQKIEKYVCLFLSDIK